MTESEKPLAAGDGGDNRIKDADMKDIELAVNRADTTKDIIEVREIKGCFRAAIPHVNLPVAWLVLFLNVFAPGTGTLILSLCALCVRTDLKKQNRCVAFLINLGTALLQTATALIIVGWIWSVYWGMNAVTEANDAAEKKKKERKAAATHSSEQMKPLQAKEENKAEAGDNAV